MNSEEIKTETSLSEGSTVVEGISTVVVVNRDQAEDVLEDVLLSSTPLVAVAHGWKVKLYLLEPEGAWGDLGTGTVMCKFSTDGPYLVVLDEDHSKVLLQSKIRTHDVYERQGESIIMWREYSENEPDTDYALSFQDTSGCRAIWDTILNMCNLPGQHNGNRYYNGMVQSMNGGVYRPQQQSEFAPNGAASSIQSVPPTIPVCTIGNLQAVHEKFVIIEKMLPSQREYYSAQLVANQGEYIKSMVTLFEELEDLDDVANLNILADIMRKVLFLNYGDIIDFVLTDNMFSSVAGIMEYDKALKEKTEYRKFIKDQAKLRQVVPINDSIIIHDISKLFRLRYLRDIILRPTIDEMGVGVVNQYIQGLTADLSITFLDNIEYIARVLQVINPLIDIKPFLSSGLTDVTTEPSSPPSSRSEGLQFLKELFFMSRGLSMESRSANMSRMLESLQAVLIDTLCAVLLTGTSTEKLCVTEILSTIAYTCPMYIRQHIIKGPIPSFPPYVQPGHRSSTPVQSLDVDNRCIMYVLINCVLNDNDAAVIEQVSDVIKVLLDPDRFDKKDKEKFLSLFYDNYIFWLYLPFNDPHDATRPINPEQANPQDLSTVITSRRFIIDIICSCVHSHAYRSKYSIVGNFILKKVLKLLESPHRQFHLGAIKLFRVCIGSREDYYINHIIQYDLFKGVMKLLAESPQRDNVITAAISDLFVFIEKESLKALICYLIEKYAHLFSTPSPDSDRVLNSSSDNVGLASVSRWVVLFQNLKIKYDQIHDTSLGSNSSNSVSDRNREHDRDDSYFFDYDDDNDTNNSNNGARDGNMAATNTTSAGFAHTNSLDQIAKYYFGEVNSDATATSTYDDYMPALKSKYEDDDIPSAAFFQGIKIRSPSVTSVSSNGSASGNSVDSDGGSSSLLRFSLTKKRKIG